MKPIRLAIVENHTLVRKGFISLLKEAMSKPYSLLFEASNGLELQKKINKNALPHIILLDLEMPIMDGFEAAKWLQEHYPTIHILVVSMTEKEDTIVRMLKYGAKGYLSKDVEPDELRQAIYTIMDKGFYYTDFLTGKLVHSLCQEPARDNIKMISLKSFKYQEVKFLNLVCTEMTYKEIADCMNLTVKAVEYHRKNLFEKLQVKSRVGLVIYAIREGWVKI